MKNELEEEVYCSNCDRIIPDEEDFLDCRYGIYCTDCFNEEISVTYWSEGEYLGSADDSEIVDGILT